jgi:arylsulfatase A-like enzyme
VSTDTTFNGRIGRTVYESKPHWPDVPRPRDGAPNVVVMLFDDLGFAHLGCYGSSIATPNIDKLAASGLRYTNFHTTALCSPTRAALLTGRNHHSVGMRGLANWNTGYPNCTGTVAKSAGTLAEMLRPTGYSTFAVGKWHLTPLEELSPAGPFDQWPLARGFDRYYGFMGGETDQWHPELYCDNHPIRPSKSPAEGYHLTEDLIDQAMGMIRSQKSAVPEKPFFTYLCFGATHAPHQAPKSYLDKYRGKFDAGWDVTRQQWFENQKRMGIIPADTELVARNPGVKSWENLSADQKTLACRLQEAFAGFLTHTDDQIGRLLSFLDEIGERENTLILLMSDNGASQEGGPQGMVDYSRYFNGYVEPIEESMRRIDEIGTEFAHNNFPWGWAQVGNTPGKRYKQNTHGGGIRDPLIVSWPKGIADKGGIRTQFHHVTDITPTVLEIIGVAPPTQVNGHAQMPIHGTSLAYSFPAEKRHEPTRKHAQYFEMLGHRGIWSNGWKAVAYHEAETPFDADKWELYHLEKDFSESRDLAATMPDKLAEMISLWWAEAGRNGVLPLDDRRVELWAPTPRAFNPRNRETYVYRPPIDHIPAEGAPSLGNRTFTIHADLERPKADTEGVLISFGDAKNGLAFYVLQDRLIFDYNLYATHYRCVSPAALPPGRMTVSAKLEKLEKGGRISIIIGGKEAASADLPYLTRRLWGAGMNIGSDDGLAVARDYTAPFAFTGTLHSVTLDVPPTKPSKADQRLQTRADLAEQ